MELPEVRDAEIADKVSQFSDYDVWDVYYEGEAEEEETTEYFEDEEEVETMDAKPEETLVFTDFSTQFLHERDKMLSEKVEAKKEELRILIGVEKKRKASEETLITPEEEFTISTKSSSESSIHPCFRDIAISDSRLKLSNLYTTYPIPDDPGLVPAFWTIYERPPTFAEDGVDKFYHIAKKSRIKPIQCLKEMLLTDKIDLQYYGINSRVVKPICEALLENTLVHTINLKDNWLSVDACYHLNELLLKNTIVHTLLLSGCKIGAEGVDKLQNGISNSVALTTLDLSDCNLRDEGLSYVVQAVCNNSKIERLALNNNYLDESCSVALRDLVSCSESLKQLELSWNSLYTAETWKTLIRGFATSKALNDLDLSWNALGKECVPYLSLLLTRSTIIEKLNLSGNRFYETDIAPIARALSRNKVLRELHLGNNPLKAAGSLALVHAVTPGRSPDSQLHLLNLTNIWANKDILPELEAIENGRPWLRVNLAGILSNYKIIGPDPKKILLKRANFEAMKPKKIRHRRNFGHFVLSLTDIPIPKAKFKELVKQFRLRLSESLIDEIMNVFAGPKHTVDQGFLKSVYLEQYPETTPMPEKPVKKKKVKGEKKKVTGEKKKKKKKKKPE